MICKKVSEILVEAFLNILRSYSEEFPSPSFVKNSEEILKMLEIYPVPKDPSTPGNHFARE